jgi:hypothetical protein
MEDLEKMLNQYSNELDQMNKIKTSFGSQQLQSSSSSSSSSSIQQAQLLSLSMSEAEMEKQKLIDKLNQAFQYFLNYVQNQADNYIKVTFNSSGHKTNHHHSDENYKQKLLDILDQSKFPADEWRRKLKELQSIIKISESKDSEFKNRLQTDLKSQPDSSVGYYLANNLNHVLDDRKKNYFNELNIMNKFQQEQTNLLNKMTSSYVTFYSWILDQWNRSIKDINQSYQTVYKRINLLFQNDATHRDITKLLDRYEKFLQVYEKQLPLEFTLSDNPRKEWREYMAKHQPEECIRLMKNELKSLENIETLKPHLESWKSELGRYDVETIRKMVENRTKIKKRIEDAVETETRETCQQKWKELNERIYKMGTGLHREAFKKFQSFEHQYQNQHKIIIYNHDKLQKEIVGLESRLSLVDKPWADWMEKRKLIGKDWAINNYWQLSIVGLLQIYDLIQEFHSYVDSNK